MRFDVVRRGKLVSGEAMWYADSVPYRKTLLRRVTGCATRTLGRRPRGSRSEFFGAVMVSTDCNDLVFGRPSGKLSLNDSKRTSANLLNTKKASNFALAA